MADYAKKKNDKLAALCKERGLTHTGKKADLVKRLEDYDTKQTATTTAPAATAKPAANEDQIDWDDEPATEAAKTATTEPAANAIAAGARAAGHKQLEQLRKQHKKELRRHQFFIILLALLCVYLATAYILYPSLFKKRTQVITKKFTTVSLNETDGRIIPVDHTTTLTRTP